MLHRNAKIERYYYYPSYHIGVRVISDAVR